MRCGVSHDRDEPSEREVGRSVTGVSGAFLCGEARAGEADQHAALLDPCGEAVAHRLVDHAAVAHDDGVDRRVEQVADSVFSVSWA